MEEKIPKEKSLVRISKEEIRSIIKKFSPLLEEGKTSLEFGLISRLSKKSKEILIPYLIDFVNDVNSKNLKSIELLNGVVSPGKIQGKLIYLTPKMIKKNALNVHYFDSEYEYEKTSESIIYFFDKPNITLLSIINKHKIGTIGFIFKEGSLLCHLAITLREKKIPAIIYGETLSFKEGKIIELDASTPNISSKGRVRYVN